MYTEGRRGIEAHGQEVSLLSATERAKPWMYAEYPLNLHRRFYLVCPVDVICWAHANFSFAIKQCQGLQANSNCLGKTAGYHLDMGTGFACSLNEISQTNSSRSFNQGFGQWYCEKPFSLVRTLQGLTEEMPPCAECERKVSLPPPAYTWLQIPMISRFPKFRPSCIHDSKPGSYHSCHNRLEACIFLWCRFQSGVRQKGQAWHANRPVLLFDC